MSDLGKELRKAAERAAQAGETPEDVMAAAEAVAEKDISRLLPAEWYTRFAYLQDFDGYFDMHSRLTLTRKSFDAIYRHIKCTSLHDSRTIKPSQGYDENRAAAGGAFLQGLTYAAGAGALCEWRGGAYGNTWCNARPEGVPGDITPWLAHAEHLIPNKAEREHVFDFMAYKVQHPNRKINHGCLHAGVPGSGKDTLWHPFFWAIGGDSLMNLYLIRNEELLSNFNYAVESELVIINELRESKSVDRKAMENFLKPLLAAPPETLQVNKKMMHPYSAVNRCTVVAFSNERKAIALPHDDRRWFVVWSEATRMSVEAASALWGWYASGGRAAIAYWLQNRDVTAFNPAAPPMVTDAKRALLIANEYEAEDKLRELIENRLSVFEKGIIASPFAPILTKLELDMRMGQITHDLLVDAIHAAGWADRGRVAARGLPRCQVYTAPGLFETATDTELRLMVHDGPVLRAVNGSKTQ